MVKEISWWIRARKRSYCANVDFFGLFWHLFVCIPYISTQKSDNFTTDLLLFIAHRGELSFLFYLAAFPASQDWFEPVCAYQLSALIIIFFLILLMFCCFLWSFTNKKCHYWSSWEWDLTISYMCCAFRNSWDTSQLIPPLVLIDFDVFMFYVFMFIGLPRHCHYSDSYMWHPATSSSWIDLKSVFTNWMMKMWLRA